VKDDFSKLLSTWMTGQRSQKIMLVVLEAMTEARQKVRASDSPFKSLARKCIDKAEDSYQEAIYQLKDGDPKLCFQYCKQGLKFISMAMLHLSENVNNKDAEPFFNEDSAEQMIVHLSEAVARFKTSVEYTNAEVNGEQKERLTEVVRMYFDAINCIRHGEMQSALNLAQSGLLYMHFLGRELEEKLRAAIVDPEVLERCRGSAATRIIKLIDEFAETQKQVVEASVVAHKRIKLYMDAARRTIDQCITSYLESDSEDVSHLAKACAMELRMANRLIEYAKYPGSGPEPEDELPEELDEGLQSFKRRIARVQRLVRDRDEEAAAVVRRLSVVNTYFARARSLYENGDYSEAERYARSAHLDIDFARQLLIDKHATYSDLI